MKVCLCGLGAFVSEFGVRDDCSHDGDWLGAKDADASVLSESAELSVPDLLMEQMFSDISKGVDVAMPCYREIVVW